MTRIQSYSCSNAILTDFVEGHSSWTSRLELWCCPCKCKSTQRGHRIPRLVPSITALTPWFYNAETKSLCLPKPSLASALQRIQMSSAVWRAGDSSAGSNEILNPQIIIRHLSDYYWTWQNLYRTLSSTVPPGGLVTYLVERQAVAEDEVNGTLYEALFEVMATDMVIQSILATYKPAAVESSCVSCNSKCHCLLPYCSCRRYGSRILLTPENTHTTWLDMVL